MKTFEIFSENKKSGKNGRRKFKVILYKIQPNDCIDETNGVGKEYNLNGITWIEEYCQQAIESIKGMFLRVEFLDEERTELCGHGLTDIIDGVPIFENATSIGVFTDGYIDEITDENGEKIKVCIGVGEIDSSCYHNFCEKLDDDIANGIYPQGSVEIMKLPDAEGIEYKYGYKDKGRIPTKFIHSGYALLGVRPSDSTAKLLELNEHKEEFNIMTEEVKTLIEQTVEAYTNHVAEINQCKAECEAKIAELNQTVENLTNEINELNASSAQIQAALDENRAEREGLDKKYQELWEEAEALRKALGEAKAKERIGELNAAIAEYSDEERAYAQAEIDAFNADPVASEINTVVDKILIGIGKKAREVAANEAAAVVAEQNAANESAEDIFGAIETAPVVEDTNIF